MKYVAPALMLFAAFALSETAPKIPASVKAIYIGSMDGTEQDAEQFRTALQKELLQAGFVTVLNSENADATLTGNVTVIVYHDQSNHAEKDYDVYLALHPKNESEKTIWNGNSHPGFKLFGRGNKDDSLEKRARDLAKQLKKSIGSPTEK